VDKLSFLLELESIIAQRLRDRPETSYTSTLAAEGLPKIARKVGEEAIEVTVASLTESDERLVDEAADLVFHLLLLLAFKELSLRDVVECLEARHERQAPRR
jgi:phosphoribosyl-AMP cyclohydrolase / phosphoribosyl-ATP pyrophosphohydrolase